MAGYVRDLSLHQRMDALEKAVADLKAGPRSILSKHSAEHASALESVRSRLSDIEVGVARATDEIARVELESRTAARRRALVALAIYVVTVAVFVWLR